MALFDWLRQTAFRFRGLTPIPFLVVALIFARPVFWGLVTGFLLMVAGEVLRLQAVSLAGGETRTTRTPYATVLVTHGPFAYLRNPMYAGNLLIYTGVGVMSMGLFPWLLVVAICCFVVQYALIISYEEDFLRARFGETYEEYLSNVHRFIPWFPRQDNRNLSAGSMVDGLASEKRTLQAEVIVVALFVGIYVAGKG